jgi:hypothetical protein
VDKHNLLDEKFKQLFEFCFGRNTKYNGTLICYDFYDKVMIECIFCLKGGFVFGFGFPVSGTEGVEACARNTKCYGTLICYDDYDLGHFFTGVCVQGLFCCYCFNAPQPPLPAPKGTA